MQDQYFVDVYGCGEPLQIYSFYHKIRELNETYTTIANKLQDKEQFLQDQNTDQKCLDDLNQTIKEEIQKSKKQEQAIQNQGPNLSSELSYSEFMSLVQKRSQELEQMMQQEESKINQERATFENNDFVSEVFIQQFIFEKCKNKIIVVGILTNEDQQYINLMIQKVQQQQQQDNNQKLFIIHNYMDITEEEVLEYYIQKDIIGCFDCHTVLDKKVYGETRNKDVKIYTDATGQVIHGVLANQNSPIGQIYNEYLFNYIRQFLKTNFVREKINFIEEFKNFLSKNICKYLQIETAQKIYGLQETVQFEYCNNKLVSQEIKNSIKIIPRTQITTDINNFIKNQLYKEEGVRYIVEKVNGQYRVKLEVVNLTKNTFQTKITSNASNGIISVIITAERYNINQEKVHICQQIQLCQVKKDLVQEIEDGGLVAAQFTYENGIVTQEFHMKNQQDISEPLQ
eukprot:TRINITY_DN8624_c0_g1_i3.p1 TRINITY_DN8624_c0_g1~~TRINITY_DN8624_c0_g1_i3.p1  ORF type:complete len:456 (-),score=90.63 TRINITY_DN8624_c0_g1_i3:100-1467(-)